MCAGAGGTGSGIQDPAPLSLACGLDQSPTPPVLVPCPCSRSDRRFSFLGSLKALMSWAQAAPGLTPGMPVCSQDLQCVMTRADLPLRLEVPVQGQGPDTSGPLRPGPRNKGGARS